MTFSAPSFEPTGARFDWYRTTCPGEPEQVIQSITDAYPDHPLERINGRNRYAEGLAITNGDRHIVRLYWGGQNGVSVEASSEDAPSFAEIVRQVCPFQLPTRMDACIDGASPGLFQFVTDEARKYARARGLTLSMAGDWERGIGRTLYIGSRTSLVFLRIYEKGWELRQKAAIDADRNLIRIEAEVKPKRAQREKLAMASPEDLFRVSWVPEFLERLGVVASKFGLPSMYRQPDDHRARLVIARQYFAVMQNWLSDAGTPDKVFIEMEQLNRKQRELSRTGYVDMTKTIA